MFSHQGDGRFGESRDSSARCIKMHHFALHFAKMFNQEDAVVPGGFVGSLLAREEAEERRLEVLQD